MGKTTIRRAALLGMSLLVGCGGSGGSTASGRPATSGTAAQPDGGPCCTLGG